MSERADSLVMRGVRRMLAILCAGVFVYAGVSKLSDPGAFLDNLRGFRILPYSAAWLMAMGVPWLEIIAGAGLVFPSVSRAARRILIFLLAVFVVAVATAWSRGLDVRCGCFGETGSASPDYAYWIGRNLLLGLAVWGSRPFKREHVVT